MSAMWPEPPDPGRGYPQQRWVRGRRRWLIPGGVAAVLLALVAVVCAGCVR